MPPQPAYYVPAQGPNVILGEPVVTTPVIQVMMPMVQGPGSYQVVYQMNQAYQPGMRPTLEEAPTMRVQYSTCCSCDESEMLLSDVLSKLRCHAIGVIVMSCFCWVLEWASIWAIFAYVTVTMGAAGSIWLVSNPVHQRGFELRWFANNAFRYAFLLKFGGSATIVLSFVTLGQAIYGLVVSGSCFSYLNGLQQNSYACLSIWGSPVLWVVSFIVMPLLLIQGAIALDLGVKLDRVAKIINSALIIAAPTPVSSNGLVVNQAANVPQNNYSGFDESKAIVRADLKGDSGCCWRREMPYLEAKKNVEDLAIASTVFGFLCLGLMWACWWAAWAYISVFGSIVGSLWFLCNNTPANLTKIYRYKAFMQWMGVITLVGSVVCLFQAIMTMLIPFGFYYQVYNGYASYSSDMAAAFWVTSLIAFPFMLIQGGLVVDFAKKVETLSQAIPIAPESVV